jgi:hypothetical protein
MRVAVGANGHGAVEIDDGFVMAMWEIGAIRDVSRAICFDAIPYRC